MLWDSSFRHVQWVGGCYQAIQAMTEDLPKCMGCIIFKTTISTSKTDLPPLVYHCAHHRHLVECGMVWATPPEEDPALAPEPPSKRWEVMIH